MNWSKLLIAASVLCASGIAGATGSPLGTTNGPYSIQVQSANQLDSNGKAYPLLRWYKLYAPPASTLKNPAPLVIVLHGGNASYLDVINPILTAPTNLWAVTNFTHWSSSQYPNDSTALSIADETGILIAVPNGINGSSTKYPSKDNNGNYYVDINNDAGDAQGGLQQHWNDCSGFNPGFTADPYGVTPTNFKVDDVAFISKMIDDIKSRGYSVDTSRIYVAGASNGGNMALRLARELPDKITAVAATLAGDGAGFYPQTGTLTPENGHDTCQNASSQDPKHRVPIFLLKGDRDSFILYNGGCNAPGSNKANGCWLPYDPKPTNGTNSDATITTLSRILTRYTYGSSPVTVSPSPYYDAKNIWDSSSISCTFYYGSGSTATLSTSDIESCTAKNNGHVDPSVEQHISSIAQSMFGNQNWDIETAVEEWMFFRKYVKSAQ
jgi:poly(3-hydroxybutyrate) depolymerase